MADAHVSGIREKSVTKSRQEARFSGFLPVLFFGPSLRSRTICESGYLCRVAFIMHQAVGYKT